MPLRDAIRVAAPRASKAIGVAGLALAGSFALLALVPLVPFREFAFAMAVGVLIDSFLVRALLVPSLMTLFGRFSHWPGMRKASLPEPTPRGREDEVVSVPLATPGSPPAGTPAAPPPATRR